MHACTDRLESPCHHPTCVVSSSTYLFGWTNHGAVTASNGANTTKMRSQQRQKDRTSECSGLCHLGRYGSHFFSAQGCPKAGKKKIAKKKNTFSYGRTIQWATKSDRPDPVLGSFWQVRTHAMMQNRDHLGELQHVIVWAIICNNKKHHEQTVMQTIFEKCSHAMEVMATENLTVADFKQYSKQ